MNIDLLPERIRRKIHVRDDGCWEWVAARQPNGYGRAYGGRSGRLAHRLVYELLIGPIPPGLVIDHLCRVRECVNPEHLEPVPQRTNLQRGVGHPNINAGKTECPKGHPYSEENTYRGPRGRDCKTCRREADRRRTPRDRTKTAA